MADEIETIDETTTEETAAAIAASGASVEEVLEQLKRKADTLGVKYSARIGIDALREKINAALIGEVQAVEETAVLTKEQREIKLRQEILEREMKLVRVRITNLNPAKKELEGELLTVANSFIGDVKKFIPYGEKTDNGYHIPFVLYTELKDRKFLSVRTRTVNGQIVIEERWVPEFALEVMEQLTPKELTNLANQQAAAAGNGSTE